MIYARGKVNSKCVKGIWKEPKSKKNIFTRNFSCIMWKDGFLSSDITAAVSIWIIIPVFMQVALLYFLPPFVFSQVLTSL